MGWEYCVTNRAHHLYLSEVPEIYANKVKLVKGTLSEVLDDIHSQGHKQLYIDGGTTIQSFLKEDLIDDICITTIPILLGGGFPLFGALQKSLGFELVESKTFIGQVNQCHYRRKRAGV